MSLTDRFVDFLRARDDAAARVVLARELQRVGHVLESFLLERWAAGEAVTEVDLEDFVWSGRRAWIGAMLPEAPAAGDLWFDVCEVVPMILLPRQIEGDPSEYAPGVLERLTPFVSWLSLRPVAKWQFGAFLELARLARRPVQVEPPFRVFDPERILAGNELEPLTRVTAGEAALYATWLGKGKADLESWRTAAAFLRPEELAALWGPRRREWAGDVDEGLHVVVTPETFDVDPDELLEDDPELQAPSRLVYGELEAPEDVGFRTSVSTQLGLFRATADPLSILDVQLIDVLRRDA